MRYSPSSPWMRKGGQGRSRINADKPLADCRGGRPVLRNMLYTYSVWAADQGFYTNILPDSPTRAYVAKMRWCFALLPVLAILAALSWAPGASAHPCHEQATPAAPIQALTAVAVHATAEARAPHDVHSGCLGCTAGCQMRCAASVAVAASFQAPFQNGRHRFEPARMKATLGWQNTADHDPPRLTA